MPIPTPVSTPAPYAGSSAQTSFPVGLISRFVGATNTTYNALVDAAIATKNPAWLNMLRMNPAITFVERGKRGIIGIASDPLKRLMPYGQEITDPRLIGRALPSARVAFHIGQLCFGVGDLAGAGLTLGADGLPYLTGEKTGFKDFVADAGAGQAGYWWSNATGKVVGYTVGTWSGGTTAAAAASGTGPGAIPAGFGGAMVGRAATEVGVSVGLQIVYESGGRQTVRDIIRQQLGP